MGYRVLGRREDVYRGYEPRKGLEGPYIQFNGRILYYDPKAGQYWDPTTDFYVEQAEMDAMHQELAKFLSK